MKAAILAGGYGKRLLPITANIPKPLVQIADKPIVDWQLAWLKAMGIDSAVILAGYLADKLKSHVSKVRKEIGIDVEFSVEKQSLGTAGALKQAEKMLQGEKEFVVVNGDIITNIALKKMQLGTAVASMALVPLRITYGVVALRNDKLIGFDEKPILKSYWMNGGVYLFSSDIFDFLSEKGDMERTTFPKLAWRGLLKGTKFSKSYWRAIDSQKDLEEVSRDLKSKRVINLNRKAI